MYIQDRFREERIDTLHAFMRAHALGTVVVDTPHLEAFPMPLQLVSEGEHDVLRGHVVRANHLSRVPSGSQVLVSAHEAGRDHPWSPGEAPGEFIDDLVQRLIGVEIAIVRLEGKRFLSQHRTSADRESLARHLRSQPPGSAHDVAREIEAPDRPPET